MYPYAKYTSRADIQNILIEYMFGGKNMCEKVKLSLHLRGFDDLACYLLYFFVNIDSSSMLAFVSSKKSLLQYDFGPFSLT